MAVKTAFVVDDSRVARVILGRLLTDLGLDVTEIGSGEEALILLKHNVTPDIIFMDMVMQGLSGVETTEQIKAETKTQAIPVIMCTGNDTTPERQAALNAGASRIVAKPPVEGELEELLRQFDGAVLEIKEPSNEAVAKVLDESALMAQIQSEINEKFRVATESWMPEVTEKVETITKKFEQDALPLLVRDITQKIAEDESKQNNTDENETVETVSREIAEKAVEEIALVKVEEAVTDFNIDAQVQTVIAAQTSAWLAMQQTQLEKAILPMVEEKLEGEAAEKIEEGLTSEVMLKVKSNVQEDVYNTIEHLTENVINPLKKQIRTLTIALVVLAVWVIVF